LPVPERHPGRADPAGGIAAWDPLRLGPSLMDALTVREDNPTDALKGVLEPVGGCNG